MSKVLVIPDIHGRNFWREPIKHIDDFDNGSAILRAGLGNLTNAQIENAIRHFEKINEDDALVFQCQYFIYDR